MTSRERSPGNPGQASAPGEKVAGFKDEQTGKFQELMVIRTGEDMKRFLKMYGVREEEIKKEW